MTCTNCKWNSITRVCIHTMHEPPPFDGCLCTNSRYSKITHVFNGFPKSTHVFNGFERKNAPRNHCTNSIQFESDISTEYALAGQTSYLSMHHLSGWSRPLIFHAARRRVLQLPASRRRLHVEVCSAMLHRHQSFILCFRTNKKGTELIQSW